MRALQVYLDSSDFSVFGDALFGAGAVDASELAHRLRRFVADGQVEFRFSLLHVVEAAPVRMEDVVHAERRARAMKFLCGNKVLEAWQSLPTIELLAEMLGDRVQPPRDRERFHGRRDDGLWFPPFEDHLAEIRATFSNRSGRTPPSLSHSSVPNRESRRRAARTMAQTWPTWVTKLRELFPISQSNERAWLDYFRDRNDVEAVSRALQEDLADVANAMRWLAPSPTQGVSELTKWLRGSSDRFGQFYIDNVDKLRDAASELPPEIRQKALEVLWDENIGRKLADPKRLVPAIASLVESDRRAIERHGLTLDLVLDHLRLHGTAVTPSMATYSDVSALNTRKNLFPLEARRRSYKVKSDIGDIFHAVYMPYVDIIRVDGFAAQYMIPVAHKWGTRMLSKREDLLPTLERMLASS